MGIAKLTCLLALIVLIMAASAPEAESAVTCNLVTASVAPCLGYLRAGGRVSPACCGGIRTLVRAARTTRDRQTACRCLKSASRLIKGLNLGRASSLSGRCHVRIPYRISPSVDCRRVG
ncbi:hypothetical protein MLD38_023938 [Melastoma candidum]|uniref:Uncharacterized protein n=1 Tax=Melastoma candidum TaxID=119954 RepID=A0ACB9NU47_9MYRT|nr:hypothetical protein MLD38_023938 [Melastoma candidum]